MCCIYSNPMAAALIRSAQAALEPYLQIIAPAAHERCEGASLLSCRKAQLMLSVQQLENLSSSGSIATAALVAACQEVQARLPDLSLVAQQEAQRVVQSLVHASITCGGCPEAASAATSLAAALLMHPQPTVRREAVSSIQAAQTSDGTALLNLVLDPLVLGGMVTVGLADEELQAPVLGVLLEMNALCSSRLGVALAAWQPWLVCASGEPAPLGPAAASLLQVVAQEAPGIPGMALWLQLQPYLMGMFSSAPAAASQAAFWLLSAASGRPGWVSNLPLLQLGPDVAPFAGLLAQAQHGSPPAPQHGNLVAAHLFSVADVEGLIKAACSSSVPVDVKAQALAQLATVACDSRFSVALGGEQGGLLVCIQHASSINYLPPCTCLVVEAPSMVCAAAVLRTLVQCLQASGDLIQPALDCLVQVLAHVPSAAPWMLLEADRYYPILYPLTGAPHATSLHRHCTSPLPLLAVQEGCTPCATSFTCAPSNPPTGSPGVVSSCFCVFHPAVVLTQAASSLEVAGGAGAQPTMVDTPCSIC